MNNRRRLLVLACALLAAMPWNARSTEATEDQLKAVFVFNFLQFVQWPTGAGSQVSGPIIIGVLDDEPLASQLDEAVRDERIAGRPVTVQRYKATAEVGDCHILFIGGDREELLRETLARPRRRGTLTVSDLEQAAASGVMIQLATRESRIRLLINLDSARAAGLTISSNLLRPAQIVRTSR